MLKAEIEEVKAHARAIAKEEVAAVGDYKTKIEKLEADIKAVSKASIDALALAVKDLEAKIKKVTPVAAKPRFTKEK